MFFPAFLLFSKLSEIYFELVLFQAMLLTGIILSNVINWYYFKQCY